MKRYPKTTIVRAQNLRSEGLTYREICTSLGRNIPKATLNYWVRNITPPASYHTKVANLIQQNIQQVHKLALIRNKEILEARLKSIRSKNISLISRIDRSIAILILSTLYWCEGAKYPSHSGIRFGSSDPEMIRLFIVLLRCCYPIDESKFRLTVQCRADQNSSELINFWQKITHIPDQQTYKAHIDKRSIGHPTKKPSYKGVCVVEYFNTDLQCELQFLGKFLGLSESTSIMKNQIK